MANIGYNNEYSYVNVTIKNQPLVFDYNNTHLLGAFGFYYNIQIKNHNETDGWVDLYSAYEDDYPTQSDSDYTNISISVEGQMGVGILASYSNRYPSTSNDRIYRSPSCKHRRCNWLSLGV